MDKIERTNIASCDLRPVLSQIERSAEFLDWYWLKSELLEFARSVGLNATGSKADITHRISVFLDTGKRSEAPKERTLKPTSDVDWGSIEIEPDTIVTDSYKNCQNVRQYFEKRIGKRFKFTIEFMAWMKTNTGATVLEAENEWRRLEQLNRSGVKSEIPKNLQYNRYLRAFFDDNPGLTMRDARQCWFAKKRRSGSNDYTPEDLGFLERFENK